MLYLDSSALAKRYFRERGSKRLRARIESGEPLFTSSLTYAEINAVIARKYLQEKSITRAAFLKLRKRFLEDWLTAFHTLEVSSTSTMSSLLEILECESLRGSDAVHLSVVVWLREQFATGGMQPGAKDDVEFAVCDKKLAEAAEKLGLRVFNPER